jgi:hypothetical protein
VSSPFVKASFYVREVEEYKYEGTLAEEERTTNDSLSHDERWMRCGWWDSRKRNAQSHEVRSARFGHVAKFGMT